MLNFIFAEKIIWGGKRVHFNFIYLFISDTRILNYLGWQKGLF